MTEHAPIRFMDHRALTPHPENARRTYTDIDGLAESIRAQGVLQPLVAIRDGDRLVVVDGNRRLKALQALGDDAPPTPVRVVAMTRREQLLAMGVTALQRQDLDPVAEAALYRRLIDEEGETQVALARQLGVSAARIAGRLALLDLDPPVQDLVAAEKLHCDPRLAKALCAVPDAAHRVALAQKLAANKVSLKGCLGACERLRQRLEEQQAEAKAQAQIAAGRPAAPVSPPNGKTSVAAQPAQVPRPVSTPSGPAVALGLNEVTPDMAATAAIAAVREGAKRVCAACDAYPGLGAAEPAWALLVHAADTTCEDCDLQAVRGSCRACPLPAFLRRVTLYQKIGIAR